MTVAELIENLNECEPSATIMIAINDSDGCPLDIIEDGEQTVCLVGMTEEEC